MKDVAEEPDGERLAENARTAVDQRYADLFEQTLLGICISTPSGTLKACNPAFAKLLGFASVEAATGVEMQSLYAEARGRERFLSELQRRGRLDAYRTTLRRRDGGVIHVITSAVGHF